MLTTTTAPSLLLSALAALATAPAAAQAEILADVNPAGGSNAREFTMLGVHCYFAATGPSGDRLWRTTGVPGNASVVSEAAGSPASLTAVGDRLFFTATDAAHGRELWVSDGTAAGTRLVVDVLPGPRGSEPSELAAIGGHVWFQADNGTHGREPWRSDGTSTGTSLVRDVSVGRRSSFPKSMFGYRGRVYFAADSLDSRGSPRGSELWRSDGTPAGTNLFREIRSGTRGSRPAGMTPFGGDLYFTATEAFGLTIWHTDGSIRGTRRAVSDRIRVAHDDLVPLGRELLFAASAPGQGVELWKLDSAGRTVLVRDIEFGSGSSHPRDFEVVGGTASETSHGRELWRTDGSRAGTGIVADVNPGRGSAFPPSENLAPLGVRGMLVFRASDGVGGSELWVSDGTLAGTFRRQEIHATDSSSPAGFTRVGSRIVFSADDGVRGVEPWTADAASLCCAGFAKYGRGCRGASGGPAPVLGSSGPPVAGARVDVTLASASPSAAAVLLIGSSDQAWGALPLPLDLGAFGAPGCTVLAAGDLQVAGRTDARGNGSVRLTIPRDRSLFGARYYQQWAVFDARANALGVLFSGGGAGRIGL